MLSLNNVGVSFGATTLLHDISFQVNPKERIALAGRNGAGKTTLLNIIAGHGTPSQGHVSRPEGITIGYLPQHMLTQDGRSVREEARSAFAGELKLAEEVDALNHELSIRTDYDSEEYMSIVQHLANASERLALFGSDKREAEIEKILKGLGFEPTDLDRPTSEFSGGWRMRIELAKILLGKPDLLLLDEPTNHLDMESIVWLESFLHTTSAAVVMVSHDRRFLDNTTTRTIELSLGKAYDYKVNYSRYVLLREERYEQQLRAYENQQKMIRETEDFIERFRYKAAKAVQVQSRIKQLEKLDRIEVEEQDRRKIHFRFPLTIASGAYPIITEGLGVAYGDHTVLKSIDITVERGDKIALVGKNGSGKTTFVRAVMGELDHTGTLKVGHQVQTAYFAQNQASLLDGSKTIYSTIDDIATGEIRTRINDILGAFMFGGEISEKKVSVLSGGEKSRLAMIKLLLSPSNLLILDEPTNHLDLSSKAVLKEAIMNYEGTVLIVSHDRDFLDGMANKVFEFREGQIINYLGGMEEYLRKVDERNEITNSTKREERVTTDTTAAVPNTTSTVTNAKVDYERQKEIQKQWRRAEQTLKKVEQEIETLEQEKAEIEAALMEKSEAQLINRYEEVDKQLNRLMTKWEEAQEQLDALSSLDNDPQ